uniref:C-type lectin domain-containing protein n=1 Tax=Amphiprion ocellaris TaxID=80972 RepID=A0AAQ5YJ90_AMPOC
MWYSEKWNDYPCESTIPSVCSDVRGENFYYRLRINISSHSFFSRLYSVMRSSLNCGLFSGQNVTFVYINIPMTWTEAQSYCRAHHTDLASVRNMTENQKVVELIPSGRKVWIGLFRHLSCDGEAEFRNWYNGEPNNFAQNEYCTAMWYSEKWNDYPCESTIPSVCSDNMKNPRPRQGHKPGMF